MSSKVCVQCTNAYEAPSGRFCSIKCHNRWWATSRTANRALSKPSRACDICGDFFQSYKKNRRYCGSHECVLAVKAAYRESNHEYIKANHLTWRTANHAKWLAKCREWRADHAEVVRAKNSAWSKAHPDIVNAKTIRHRARKRNAEGHFTAEEFRAICKKQGGRCNNCFKKCKLTVDHIVPLARGGTNFAYNIQGLCLRCNQYKSAKIMDYAHASLFDKREAS